MLEKCLRVEREDGLTGAAGGGASITIYEVCRGPVLAKGEKAEGWALFGFLDLHSQLFCKTSLNLVLSVSS